MPEHRFRISDLLWIMAVPLFVPLHTFLHEGSHALAGMSDGLKVTYFRWFLSGIGFDGEPRWTMFAAPYLTDVTMVLAGYLCLRHFRGTSHIVWGGILYVCMLCPLADLAVNYSAALLHGRLMVGDWAVIEDIWHILRTCPQWCVHASFITVLAVSIAFAGSILTGRSLRSFGARTKGNTTDANQVSEDTAR